MTLTAAGMSENKAQTIVRTLSSQPAAMIGSVEPSGV